MTRFFQRRRVMALAMLSAAAVSLAGFTALPQASSAATPRSSSHYGGVLYMLGTGDVDYFDPNITYYTVGYLGVRIWTETLLAYPAIPGKTLDVVPQLATGMPTVTDGGTLYTLTIRKGVEWNTTPPRQVTAADARRGLERTCNPAEPFGGVADYEGLIVGMPSFCKRVREGEADRAGDQAVPRHALDPGRHSQSGEPVADQLQARSPGELLHQPARDGGLHARADRGPELPAGQCRLWRSTPFPTARTRCSPTFRRGALRSSGTRCGRRRSTRSARPMSTRSR